MSKKDISSLDINLYFQEVLVAFHIISIDVYQYHELYEFDEMVEEKYEWWRYMLWDFKCRLSAGIDEVRTNIFWWMA